VTLAFDATTHAYSDAGGALVSVTQAIRDGGLMGETPFWTVEARDRGTFVHAMTELADQEDLDEDALDVALRPYLDAYRWFQHDHQPEWSHVEAQRADGVLRYAGTVDRAGRLVTCKHAVVLDIKSGTPAPWHRIQLSAYKRLVAAELSGPIVIRYGLYLSADGTYRLDTFPLDDREDWQTFQAALALAQWIRRYLK
jgi:hypothetical protein